MNYILVQDQTKVIKREIDILQRLNHPCIIAIENAVETDAEAHIVME